MQQDMQYKHKHLKNVWLGNSNEIMSIWNYELVYAAVLTESNFLYVVQCAPYIQTAIVCTLGYCIVALCI